MCLESILYSVVPLTVYHLASLTTSLLPFAPYDDPPNLLTPKIPSLDNLAIEFIKRPSMFALLNPFLILSIAYIVLSVFFFPNWPIPRLVVLFFSPFIALRMFLICRFFFPFRTVGGV